MTAGGSRAISRVEILLRGEHFPLENFIHSVNIGVLITKTPRISATSFSPPGGKKVSLHTYWQPTTLAPPARSAGRSNWHASMPHLQVVNEVVMHA